MPKRFLEVVIGVSVCVATFAAAPPTTKESATQKSTVAKKPAAKGSKPVSSKSIKGKIAQGPPRQAQPSSDRYREIQSALAAKGYYKGEPTGVWDQDSISAMRQFQEDQKLEATGKVNSRSLISLGLGPHNDAVPAASPQPDK
jgi:peptidoglycan hydrolase-like protein with peptidoglycan-binding domain